MTKPTNDLILNKKSRQKSNLAKLLAGENITVEIRNTKTAYFNVTTRVLTIPKYVDGLSNSVYNMLLGHEVGHALETPESGWIEQNAKFPDLMNIIEDIRIEQKIKQKFPGIKKDFIDAYNELYANGFFGDRALKNINELSFVDRLNIHSKVGISAGVIFTPAEDVIVQKSKKIQTWDDAVNLTIELAAYINENSSGNNLPETDESDSSDESELPPSSDEEDFQRSGSYDSGKENDTKNDTENDKEHDLGALSEKNRKKDDIAPETQKNFEKHTNQFIDRKNEKIANVYIPTIDPKGVIVPYKEILQKYQDTVVGFKSELELSKYRKTMDKSINYLIQQFNMKRNAKELQKTQYQKTGNLDVSRIHEYMLNEDIFIRNTILDQGQSHGLVLFMDWSASMRHNLQKSIYQLLAITDFCQKTKIPFDVYAFTTENYQSQRPVSDLNNKEFGNIVLDKFVLFHVLSSEMNNTSYTQMKSLLLQYQYMTHAEDDILSYGGTPLNETIIAAMTLVPKFKKKYNLDIVNTVFITDGEGSFSGNMHNGTDDAISFVSYNHIYLHHKKIGFVEKLNFMQPDGGITYNTLTHSLLRCLREITNSNVVGFYLKPVSMAYNMKSEMRELMKNGYIIKENSGYNEYYIILSTNDQNKTELEEQPKRSVKYVSYGDLMTIMNGNKFQRSILDRFIKLIT